MLVPKRERGNPGSFRRNFTRNIIALLAVAVLGPFIAAALMVSASAVVPAGHTEALAAEENNHGDLSQIEEKQWYLAEGYTGGMFDTWVLIQNPGAEDAAVTMEFQLSEGAAAPPHNLIVPAGTRKSVHLDELPGLSSAEVSTKITADRGIFVERSIYFQYGDIKGGTSTVGCVCPDFDWLFAEGYTSNTFDTYILVQNPGDSAAKVTMEFQLPPGANAEPCVIDVQPNTRRTVKLDDLPGLGATAVSTKISSTQPVIAERAMYFDYYGNQGGHCSLGLTSTDQEFFIPEGYTGGNFDTYLLIQNPGDEEAEVVVQYQLPGGLYGDRTTLTLAPNNRHTIKVDDVPNLSSTDVSTLVETSVPTVVERAVYFDKEGNDGGTCSQASDSVSDVWHIPEGCTRNGYDTWVLVQNPTDETVRATLEFQLAPGYAYPDYELEVPPQGRGTVNLNKLEGFPETDVSTTVRSDNPVIVESSMYFDYQGRKGGHSSLGHIPNMLTPEGVILDSETSELVTYIDDDMVAFTGTTELLESIGEGDVVSSKAGGSAPNGFLRKVTDVLEAGNITTLLTEQASVVELIQYGNFYAHHDVPAQAGGVNANVPFDINLGGAELKGDVGLSVGLDISIHVKWKWKIIPVGFTFKIAASVGENVSLELKANEDVNVKKEVKIDTIDLPPIDAGPLVFFPKINLYIGFDGTVAARTDLSCSEKTSATVGFGYDGWYTIHDFHADATANASIPYKPMDNKTYVKEEIECLLYDVVGPYIDLSEYIRLHSGPGEDPWWVLYGGVESNGGVDINLIVWHLKWHGEIFSKEWVITSAPPKPKPQSVTPNAATVGSEVTIDGSDFGTHEGGDYVSFGDVRATDYSVWNGNQIKCVVPQGASGKVELRVHNEGGTSDPLDFYVVPTLAGIDKVSGNVGDELTLTGNAFGDNRGSSYVSFGGVEATDYTAWSDGQIKCKVPLGASGTVPVSVTTSGGTSNSFNYTVMPKIDGIDPASQIIGGEVTVKGSAFGAAPNGSYVSFGGVKVADFSSWSDTAIKCNVPAGVSGQIPVTVTNGAGTSNMVPFGVLPNVTGVDPAAGIISSEVVINGTGFGPQQDVSFVSFGGTQAAEYTLWSDNQIKCKVPQGIWGQVELSVTTPGGQSNKTAFGVQPKIDTIDPPYGNPGVSVTLSGSAFGPQQDGSFVSFNDIKVTDYQSWSDNQIKCMVPAEASERVKVTVTTAGGTSPYIDFSVIPKITKLDPGQALVHQEIAIDGTGFGNRQEGSFVKFASNPATEYVSWADNQIKVRVPAGQSSGPLSVVTEGGVSNEVEFTLITPDWYLAEGTTAWGFSTYITIENSNPEAVNARITYQTPEGDSDEHVIPLPAASQTTISPADDMGFETDFSTKVECLERKTISVDRTMFWTGPGAPSPDGHCSIGTSSPAETWYLAEGSSAWGFETWLLIQNPNGQEATCTVTYMTEDGTTVPAVHKVPPNSRRSFNMADYVNQRDASTEVHSDLPVVCERAMYRNNRREGHESIGTSLVGQDYYTVGAGDYLSHDRYLAEGTSSHGFTTYILIQNPNDFPAEVNVTYMTENGPVEQPAFNMPALSRKTILANSYVPNADFSTHVHADVPIIAERAMYWGAGTPLGEAAHGTVGMADAHKTIMLPDGQSSDGHETFTLVQNPNEVNVEVEISYLMPDGTGNITFTETIAAKSRRTFNLSDRLPDGRAAIFVTCKTSGGKIMAERSMYWNNRGAGTCTIGGYED